MIERAEVIAMLGEGEDVMTWFELRRHDREPVPVVNWSRVSGGKVQRIRATFDPRPLLD
jgi:hypothetical protein